MVFQRYIRSISLTVGIASLLALIVACGGRPETANEMSRYGDDVVVSGSTPFVADTVAGDAILAGEDIRLSGEVGGDYLGAGGSQVVSGRIYGSVRAAGGDIRVSAVVDRNATIAGGTLTLDSASAIGRNAYLAGGLIQVHGTVQGTLHATGGTVIINGIVNSDVEIFARELRIGPSAQIGGNLRYRVPEGGVEIDSAARIAGTVTASHVPRWQGTWYMLRILWMIGFVVTGVVFTALFPRFTAEAVQILRARPGPSGLAGIAWTLLVPIAVIILAVTVIGLPIAMIMTGLYFVMLYLGPIVPAVWLGQRILHARTTQKGHPGEVLNFLVGIVILLLIRMIPVVGSIVMALATVLGLGAILFRMRAACKTSGNV